jgi:hypothetical protein
MHNEADTAFWENVDADVFLSEDAENPARSLAAAIIEAYLPCSMIEIGPGPGTDYFRHFSMLPGLSYRGIEGCRKFAARLIRLAGSDLFVHGTFTDLKPCCVDVAYTKATLEHQPDFRWSLKQMLLAARRAVVINWYRPLLAEGPSEICYNAAQRLHYNRYSLSEIVPFIEGLDWRLDQLFSTDGPENTPYAPANTITVFTPKAG